MRSGAEPDDCIVRGASDPVFIKKKKSGRFPQTSDRPNLIPLALKVLLGKPNLIPETGCGQSPQKPNA